MADSGTNSSVSMTDVLEALKGIQENQAKLASEVESVSLRLDTLAPPIQVPSLDNGKLSALSAGASASPIRTTLAADEPDSGDTSPTTKKDAAQAQRSGFTSRIILTTYPKQIGINPLPLQWGAPDALTRGPVVVSRSSSTIRRRNGKYGYAKYCSRNLPDFTNTEPAANIGPFPQWGDEKKIVAMDPWGHLAPWLFADTIEKENVDIRPTIAITKAHMKLPELEESVRSGRLVPDGKVCLNAQGELAVTKFAVEPVWYLPGVAERFGIDEGVLRRSLFEHTGGGLTVYCFGDPAKMSDEKCRLALRIHDECNGSDVFGSDICTCRPYLIFGIEEAVKEAQNGGSGVVIYFRKEGRALGEVTKYLVYNARKRGEDRASDYFKRTENVAGVKDMRFQALMPDILHWLGIKKIDRMLSMSNMKYDAIVGQGIPIHERVELPEELIPADSRVEIDAKITAGYFTNGNRMTAEELKAVQGRMWDDIDH
ncbi:GTP cyclohydrolase N terminal-domain-containing protein [Daldinia caldariorum]|uniref:GTP cyclohydrolase N terminal-domain-containing protein n=1 Tax=Daldinia caldariorum TaxID=326644 RepID=UPI00200777E7|nr:GTP cyclohydrolase N terminal-domain-containing protein [Daldinia caldariorum]KAI1468497.1 GTP cyclohydrolase N terminal-domain-containing protein [Daldinia caldariorum]